MVSKSSTDGGSTEVLNHLKQTGAEFGLSLLASTLAHEIRNPLQSIRLSVEAAQRGQSVIKALQVIGENVTRIETVIDRVQRINEKYEVRKELVNLRDLVDACLSSIQFWVNAAGINVRTRIHWEGEPICTADPELLQQVLLNLFMNSIQAMPDGGILNVSISEVVNAALIEVSDTGTGIAPDALKLVGTPFFTTKEGGHGLGMAFCKTIASLHGGSIEIESRENEGTKVSLTISNTSGSEEEVGNA